MRLMLALAFWGLASGAYADPCEGALPAKGAKFGGVVRYIVDGDGLCVGDRKDPGTWIEVRLADFNAPELKAPGGTEARAALTEIAMGQRAICIARHKSYDRVVAACRIGNQSLGALMRDRGEREGGN